MDGLFNWIMNSPHNTMITKVVVCEYDGDSISGNLAAGTYLLIGYRRNNYAHLTAYSYWGSRPMSVATIENGAWAKRFEKVITNTDLQTRFNPIRIDGAKKNTFSSVLKDKCNNAVNFIAFAENAENPITDNPFSFAAGYVIVFHSGLIRAKNVFTAIGVSADAEAKIETKRLDLMS